MKKAVIGGLMWTILLIIIGVLGVALLWLFLTGAGETIVGQFENLVDSFKRAMCNMIGGMAGWMLGC